MDVDVYLHGSSAGAILVNKSNLSVKGDMDKTHQWLPISQISYITLSFGLDGHMIRVTAPEWLLKAKGLL